MSEPIESGRVRERHRRAAVLLAADWPKVQVAREVGVSETTVHRWLRRSWFQTLVSAERERRRLADEDQVFALIHEATEVLREDLKSERPETRIRAARQLASFYGPTYEAMVKQRAQQEYEREMRERMEARRDGLG